MAKTLVAVLVLVALLAGCQQQAAESLPLPNLNGPVVSTPPAPTPDPSAPKTSGKTPPGNNSRPRVAGVPDEWLPRVRANDWKWIVIHHSATPAGSAAQFDRSHRQKGWDELGYHFVIGNGTGSRDGQIEVGSRWPKQKYGAHAKTPDNRFNDFGIGICLVGDFDIDRPTAAQVRAVAKLAAYLMQTYHIPPNRVIGHCDAKPTDCPGRHFSVAQVRQMATHLALAEDDQIENAVLRMAKVQTQQPAAH